MYNATCCLRRNECVVVLLHEDEIDRQDEADKGCQVVPVELFALEEYGGEDGEDNQRDDFLDNLKLHEREGTAILLETDTVGRHLTGVLKERYRPGEEDDCIEWPMGGNLHLLQFQMPVPGKCHKDVGDNQQEDCIETFHRILVISG